MLQEFPQQSPQYTLISPFTGHFLPSNILQLLISRMNLLEKLFSHLQKMQQLPLRISVFDVAYSN